MIEEKKEGGVKRESLAISNELKNIIMNVFTIFIDFKKWYLFALACLGSQSMARFRTMGGDPTCVLLPISMNL